MGENFSGIYNFKNKMDENKDYHDMCPLDANDSFSLSPEIVGDSYGNYNFSKYINDICKNQDEDAGISINRPSDSNAFRKILADSEYPESQILYYNGNYITDSCVESTDMLRNSNIYDNNKKKERRKTCTFLNFSRKKTVSSSQCTKSEISPQSTKETKYSSIHTCKFLNFTRQKPVSSFQHIKSETSPQSTKESECSSMHSKEHLDKSESFSNLNFPDQCIDIPIDIDENLPPTTQSLLDDTFSTYLTSHSHLDTENDQPIMNSPPSTSNVITIPVIDGKFTVDGGVFLSSSAVLTEPLYSGDSDSLRVFESEGVNHDMQLIQNNCNYDITDTSSPLLIDVDLESDNSRSSLQSLDEPSNDFNLSFSSTSFAHSHHLVKGTDSVSMDQSSSLQTELRSDSDDMSISHTSTNQSTSPQTELRSEPNNMTIDPIPPGRKRRPRVSYDTLSEEQKLQRIRIMNNDACLRYRKNKKKTVKELQKDIDELETRNKNLHEIYEALKARKEKAEQIISGFLPGPTQGKSKGKSVKRKSSKQKKR